MPYHYLTLEDQFNQKYQALVDYLKMHENTPFPDILKHLAQLPNEHILKDFFVVNGAGKSFLHMAAAEGNLLVITFLKETGHEIDLQDFNKKTPLYDACNQLKLSAVNALLGYGANPNLGDSDVFFTAMRDEERVNYRGENIPLVAAIKSDARVTVNEFAIATRTPEDLSLLTDEWATERARALVVKKLLAQDANFLLLTGIDHSSSFHRAIELKKLLVVNEIADVGGPEIFDQRNRDGEAALNLAVSYWEKNEKEDPESQAEIEIEEKITDMIIEHAEVKLPNLLAIKELKFGNTPIHSAVICSNYKVLKKLLLKGYKFDSLKNLSRQNHQGNTPIHEAINEAWRGPKILGLLLSIAMPDDLAKVNHAGETPIKMAERLLQEANSVKFLVEKVEKSTSDLEQLIDESSEIIEGDEMDVPAEIGLLLKGVRALSDSDPLDNRLSSENGEPAKTLSLEIDNFIIELEKYDIEGLVEQAREQVEKFERDVRWSVQDAKDLLAKATTLNLHDLHIPETLDINQANLSESDATLLAMSARNLLEKYDQGKRLLDFSLDKTDELVSNARTLLAPLKQLEFFQQSYLDSLSEVNQEKYLAWQTKQVQLPSSFSNLETVDTSLLTPLNPIDLNYNNYNAALLNYEDGFAKYLRGENLGAIHSFQASVQLFKSHYAPDLALAQAHRALASAYLSRNNHPSVQNNIRLSEDNKENAQLNLKAAIEIFLSLQDYRRLEFAYQDLAKTYITSELSVANYEKQSRNKLSAVNSQEQLHGHLALAGLYKDLREQNFPSSAFSRNDLQIRESYHYHQAYKLTQGNLDNSARVVLQREIGIANNANLGTYNIQQCVAVVAFDPATKKVVLSHFDKSSGPVSFIEQLVKEFSGRNPIHLFISGGRDLWSPAETTIPSLISENNIDLVLKQIHLKNVEDAADGNPDNGRFKIKACDVGNKPSPQGIVFDVQSQGLLHATPNFADSSIESRAVNFMLQKVNEDYVRPLNRVDFTKSEAVRTITFSQQEQSKIYRLLSDATTYYANNPQTKAWEHDQVFYPLKMVSNEMAVLTLPDFTTGLLTAYRTQFFNSRRGNLVRSNSLEVAERVNTLDLEDRLNALQMVDPNNFLDDQAMQQMLRCLGSRRRREVGLCTLDSEHLLEGLSKLSESKQAEILDHVTTRKVGGSRQDEINILVQNYKQSRHLHTLNAFSSKTMEGMFATDAIASLVNGDKTAAALWVDFKLLDQISKSGSRTANVALNLYSTYENFNNLLKNTNNPAAWLRFASSGSQAVVDVGSFSMRAVEGVSEAFAALEISAPFEAVGGSLVTVLILADRFYEAGKAVGDEEDLLRKDFSFGTKVTEFGRAFFGFWSAYQEKINDISEYENLLPQLKEFLKKHPEFEYYVSPAIQQISVKRKCISRGLTGKGCRRYQYTPVFAEIKNNSVNFTEKQTGFKLNNEVQDALSDGKFACLPTGNDSLLTKDGAYRCDGAFALISPNSTGSTAFFNLGNGDDRALGFKNYSNFFIVNNGTKAYQGGDQTDLFLLSGTWIVTATDQKSEIGGLHGGAGLDTLDLREFKPEADHIELNLLAGYMKYANNTLCVTGMERVLGGSIPLSVIVACDTKALDTAAVRLLKSPDSFFIPSDLNCDYDLQMHLHSHVSVTNAAERGQFIYTVSPDQGNVLINLMSNRRVPTVSSLHQIELNARLSDVSAINFPTLLTEGFPRILQLMFSEMPDQPERNFNFTLYTPQFNSVFLRFSDQAQLKMGNKNLYYVHLDLNQSASEIMDYYAPLMRQHNLIGFFITVENEQILIGHNKHEVMQNNPEAFQTHLCGNGGEAIFVIKSGMPSLSLSHLPILQVNIYHLPGDAYLNSLDFRQLMQQVKTQMNRTAQLYLVTPNAENNLGDDLLLVLGIPSSKSNHMRSIVTVGIPKAFHPSQHLWFKKYLHIYLDDEPLQIKGRHKHLSLIPVPSLLPNPLLLDKKLEIVKLNVHNLKTNTTVIIPQAHATGDFFKQNKTSLIWTNTLINTDVPNRAAPFTLLIDKFFQESKNLSLQFTDETLTLTNVSAKINNAADFAEAKNARLANLRKAFLAIINPKQHISYATTQLTHASSNTAVNNVSVLYKETNEIPNFRERRSVNTSDSVATSTAATLQNWMHFPRIIATNILQAPRKIFIILQTNIKNLYTNLPDTSISCSSDSLQPSSLLGNKNAIAYTNPNRETMINKDLPLKSCVSFQVVDTNQESRTGVNCAIPTKGINFFHHIPRTNTPDAFKKREANLVNYKSVEWYGRPAKACEGEKVTANITSHLPQHFFDRVDSVLLLGIVTVALSKNIFTHFFPKPVADTRYQLVEKFSFKISFLLEIKLIAAILKLKRVKKQKGLRIKELNWISLQLEDRQEEFEKFRKHNRITNNEVTEFSENLFALQEMLNEVEPTQTSYCFSQRDNDVFARAANANYPSNSFGLTRFHDFFEGVANQSNIALLNRPIQTQKVLISCS